MKVQVEAKLEWSEVKLKRNMEQQGEEGAGEGKRNREGREIERTGRNRKVRPRKGMKERNRM